MKIRPRPARISPTCVGTTPDFPASAVSSRGSAPRAWGRLLGPRRDQQAARRISPTCVGTTARCPRDARMPRRISPTCVGTTAYEPSSDARETRISPTSHVRGDDVDARSPRRPRQRISPTCVGTTEEPARNRLPLSGSAPRAWGRRRTLSLPRGPDQPHVRGDDGSTPAKSTRSSPDQPHVRGDDVESAAVEQAVCRISPTCMGTTPSGRHRARPTWRISPTCVGTTRLLHANVKRDDGSAPRAWGVGTTLRSIKVGDVHYGSAPRAWGRLVRASSAASNSAGSAPRAWGRPMTDRTECRRTLGSAPRAWGRLPTTCRRARPRSDQPHVRGDDVHRAARRGSGERISPTCVGTTIATMPSAIGVRADQPHVRGDNFRCSSRRPLSSTDQPHVRGDDVSGDHSIGGSPHGSTPRAWGRRGIDPPTGRPRARISPTCVGRLTQ